MRTRLLYMSIVSLIFVVLTGCGPSLTQVYTKVEGVPSNKALVYIYRTSGLGGGIYYDVKANGKVVTTLYSGGYFPYVTDPGEIEFTAKTEASDSVTLNAISNQTYYLKGSVGVGFIVGHPHLTIVPAEEAEKEIVDCKLLPGPEQQEISGGK